ncbi:MAG TPA: ABC transporter permease [Chloroflexota bacterium]|jgi:NitT/TauT family transport system permease protein
MAGPAKLASVTSGELAGARPRGVTARRPVWRTRSVQVNAARIAVAAAILLAWEFAVEGQNEVFFSKPSLVAQKLVELFAQGKIWQHIQITVTEIFFGYLIGAAFGLVVGALLGRSKALSDVFQPFILMFYSIPKIALAPLFIIWLGLGINSKIAVVVLSAFFLVFVNTYSGMLSINEELVNLARIMGASRWQVTRRVIAPAASPYIMLGLKTAVPYAVIGAILGEFIGSNKGLGYFILYAGQTFDSASLFAGIIILVSIVFIANQLLTRLEGRVLRWQPSSQAVHVEV